ncbi:unnamed protein product [Cuscuta europaea]|uniref:Uncharacterized protein n=1 Tax=Cuscuta europaea TaxID=41803 RepID=A0A9P0ZVY9_CUSEU|nr:unnamed protein product [Cuscuta europaea]
MSECSCQVVSTGGCYMCGKKCVGILLDACSWCDSNYSHYFCTRQIKKNRKYMEYLCKDCSAWVDAPTMIPRKSDRIIQLNRKYFNADMVVGMSFEWMSRNA